MTINKILILVVSLALLAAACGESFDAATNAAESTTSDEGASMDVAADAVEASADAMAAEADAMAEEFATAESEPASDASASLGSGGGSQALDTQALGREIIFTATVSVGVDDVEAAGREATAIIADLGGFVFGQNTQGGAQPRSEIVFKVRPDDFAEALERLGGIGELRNQQITTDDVTERVVDLTSRIEVAELGVQRLRDAMEGATDLEDFARLEQLLLSRESDLEVMRGTLRTLRDRIDLATITLVLEQDALRNSIGLDITVFEGHESGALCPGRFPGDNRFEPGDEVTICFETVNLGDQALSDIVITETVLEIEGREDLIVVAGDPNDVQPGQSVLWAFETTVERDLQLRAGVTAQPTVGDDDSTSPIVRAQASPQIPVDEDAADPGFGDGFGAAVSVLRGMWTLATVVVGFIVPLLVLLPLVWLAVRGVRALRARRRERVERRRSEQASHAQAVAGTTATSEMVDAMPPPPPPTPTPEATVEEAPHEAADDEE